MTDNRLFSRGIACDTKGCGHNSRDHDRSKKIDGVWTGKCTIWNCQCKQYTKPKELQKI